MNRLNRFLNPIGANLLVALLFYLSAQAGYLLKFENTDMTVFWPPSGIFFGIMILYGFRLWPGIVLGTFAANGLGTWFVSGMSAPFYLLSASLISISNLVELWVGLKLIQYFIRDKYPFNNAAMAFRFLFIAVIMSFVSGFVGALALELMGRSLEEGIWNTTLRWMLEKTAGILLITPIIISFPKISSIRFTKNHAIETAIALIWLLLIYWMYSIPAVQEPVIESIPLLFIPFLIWLAFRFQLFVASTAVLISSIILIYFTLNGYGPLVLDTPAETILMLQIFLGVRCLTVLVIAASVAGQRNSRKEVIQLNQKLEEKVEVRTKELNEEIESHKKTESQLKVINKELVKRNQELDNFVYSVSHDLRSPMASVLGLIYIASKESDPGKFKDYLAMMKDSVHQQEQFIKEILDQSRNSRIEVRKEEVNFKLLIEEIFEHVKYSVQPNKKFTYQIHVDQQIAFFSDSWRIKIILNNLISNSIRHNLKEEVKINVSVMSMATEAVLIVEDNGEGIPDEHVNKVFEMFYRASEKTSGSGLGLYIVKEAVQKLNGEVKIDSREGEGTKIEIKIPAL